MTNYGVIYGKVAPPTIQMTDSMVFVADEIQPFTQQYEGKEITGFKYNYKSYFLTNNHFNINFYKIPYFQ